MSPMVVDVLVELEGELSRSSSSALLARLAQFPRFRERPVEASLPGGRARWEADSEFVLARHVDHVELDDATDAALRAFVSRTVGEPLDLRYPGWHVYVIQRPGVGTAILFRVHHCMADGFALLGLLAALEDVPTEQVVRSHASAGQPGLVGSAMTFARLAAMPNDPSTPLKAPLSGEKQVAWTTPIELRAIKRDAHLLDATVNDVLVAVLAGALGRYLSRRGLETRGLSIHAMVPVNLRTAQPPTRLGNQFGLFLLDLPLGIANPVTRIVTVKRMLDALKASHEAVITNIALKAMGRAPRSAERLAVEFFARKASLVLTNVPGPVQRTSLAGVPISRISFWVPQAGRLGLGLSIFSYAGEVTVGIFSDAALVPDSELLAHDIEVEFAVLDCAVRSSVERSALSNA
ncbi:Wax ester synthase/acyl-CoA:diacylglycerol acyltransferase [Labilithrix luteola]|uniref:diacylglycerol O-acyltransferase n=2 Tax=Labilithrix luteola TaxID=1391654 RepID=A0A0K1PRW1_9BACT|nr:Wax ester synthase/acyl-CoA:diacylglycerol acyltransferase [Labilithrix luteola]